MIITNPITDRTEIAGSAIVYNCSATGYPPPTIVWKGPGIGTTTNIVSTNTVLPTVHSSYTLTYLSLNDRGSYYCTALTYLVNEMRTNSSIGSLSLQCKLFLFVFLSHYTLSIYRPS